MYKAVLHTEKPNHFTLKGDFNKYTVGQISDPKRENEQPLLINLKGIESFDSSLVALLVDWALRLKPIYFEHPSTDFKSIASAMDVESLLFAEHQ